MHLPTTRGLLFWIVVALLTVLLLFLFSSSLDEKMEMNDEQPLDRGESESDLFLMTIKKIKEHCFTVQNSKTGFKREIFGP